MEYGSTAKDNLYKIAKAQRKILRAFFCRNKSDIIGYIFERNKIMNVFEIYLMDLFTKVIKQLRMESPRSSLNTAGNHSYSTRRRKRDCNLSPTVGLSRNRNLLKIDYGKHTFG